jgi:hypothetical protein
LATGNLQLELELILIFSGLLMSYGFLAIDWGWFGRRRNEDDPQLSSWLGWFPLPSMLEAEVLIRLLFRPSASCLPKPTRVFVGQIRAALGHLLLGTLGWFVVYYLATSAT